MSAENFRWTAVKDRDEMEAFYRSIIPRIRDAAKSLGYAIGVHGSLRRDCDLIAAPWIDSACDKDTLARAIHQAACGIEMQTYHWEKKPLGRVATSFPVCFPEWNEPNLGHIDLSVLDQGSEITRLQAERDRLQAELDDDAEDWIIERTLLENKVEQLQSALETRDRALEAARAALGTVHKIRAISMSGGQPSDGNWSEMHFRVLRRITAITDEMCNALATISQLLPEAGGKEGGK